MLHFLKLIRWPNLMIVIISMVFTLFFLINPILNNELLKSGLTLFQFVLLVTATLSITVGGYLINDFFDMQADNINKPGENQVGKRYAVARIQLLYWVFTIGGVLIGSVLSWILNQLNYAFIFVFAAGLLWLYSERYQCIPIVGNVVVAFLSALSFGLVWAFEFFALTNNGLEFSMVQANFPLVNHFVLMYMGFAFMVSFLREVTKDIEDYEGDDRFGCRTFAVAYGQKKSKIVGVAVAMAGLLFSVWFQVFFFQAGFWLLFGYFFAIDLLFIIVIFSLYRVTTKSDYSKLSMFIKMLMLTGILSMILVYFEV